MYLKRLELMGFKSFAERTVLEFGPGVTAIVGPNGAGKSNVADAIRWVLGEQNPRLLRGMRMEDVIFNGSETKRALGLAEVLLTLDNSDGVLPVAFQEVTIGRRIDRGGGSDYLLNQSPCRLRDVQELFYDTGLGREAYSLVGQGRVDEILSAKAAERRSLLEEAAGIVRFKARKQEALRHLGHVEERLTRLGDILAELEGRLQPLAQEAEKARRHRELSAALREVEIRLHLIGLREAQSRWQAKRVQVDGLRGELDQWQGQILQWEHELAQCRARLGERERDLEAAREARARWGTELERLRGQRQVIAERRRRLEDRLRHLEREREALEQKLRAHAQEERGDQARLDEVRARHEALRQRRETLVTDLHAAERDAQGLEAALATARERVYAAMAEASAAQAESTRLEAELGAIRMRWERADQEIAAAQRQLEATRAEVQELARVLDHERTGHASAAARADELALERKRLEDRRATHEERWRRLQERLADARSRVRALEALQRSYEGYYAGVRAVLLGRDQGEPAFADVIGVIGELIATQPQFELAIEAALGGGIQYVVTRTGDGAQRAIEHLRRTRGGRVTFLPLDGLRPARRDGLEQRVRAVQGIVGWADELVSFPDTIRTAVEHLLARVLVAQDLTSARRAAKATDYRLRVVTLDGDVVHAGGAISGGSPVGRRVGLLNRQQELERARAELAQLEAARSETEREGEELRSRLRAVAEERERVLADVGVLKQRVESKERELEAARRRMVRIEENLRTLGSERAQLEARAAEVSAAAAAQRQQAAIHAEQVEQARRRVQELEGQLPALQSRAATLRERLAETVAAIEATAEQVRALEEWEARARRERHGLEERLTAIAGEWAEVTAQLAACEEAEREARAAEEVAVREHRRAEESVASLTRQREQAAAGVSAVEAQLRELRARQDELRQRVHRAELEEARLRLEADQLRERLREQFGVEPDRYPLDELDEGKVADPGNARDEALALRERVRRLRAELEELGPVNPQAESEFHSLRERYRFLRGQVDDMVAARTRLRWLLGAMDERMEERFHATFEELRATFQRVFRRLFGGGRADLRLEVDPGGDGPPGVEILAQPPGKRMQPLSLLSGGERALTAIALLFALLEVKPTPFCIVDEVDAALDDANLQRFASYLRELSDRMQFIVITHQKATMAAADALYGVTLDENGTSRLVAVRLHEEAAEAVAP